MSFTSMIYPEDMEEFYELVKLQVHGLTEDVPYFIANMSNISALLNDALDNINWVGFYFMKNGKFLSKLAVFQ